MEPNRAVTRFAESMFYLLYNGIGLPLMVAGAHGLGLVNSKFRRGIAGRYSNLRRVKQALRTVPENRPRFLLHAASLGEFEQAKAFLRELKTALPDAWIAVTFFSPSGFEHVQPGPLVDWTLYAPFDWPWSVARLFSYLKPAAFFVSRYDVWPNLIAQARHRDIPTYLLNASFPASRSAQLILSPLYRQFSTIFAISKEDATRFATLVPAERVVISGDTKFDQVWQRRQEAQEHPVLPTSLYRGRPVLVCGSIWPEDERHLIPAVQRLFQEVPGLLLILCPHEPTPRHVQALLTAFRDRLAIPFSQVSPGSRPDVLVIDRVGILPLLYATARVAYVGGGFGRQVHNVLEPAVYGIPVLFGPRHRRVPEARALIAADGAFEVNHSRELFQRLRRCLTDSAFCRQAGQHAGEVVRAHLGSSRRVLEVVLNRLQLQTAQGTASAQP